MQFAMLEIVTSCQRTKARPDVGRWWTVHQFWGRLGSQPTFCFRDSRASAKGLANGCNSICSPFSTNFFLVFVQRRHENTFFLKHGKKEVFIRKPHSFYLQNENICSRPNKQTLTNKHIQKEVILGGKLKKRECFQFYFGIAIRNCINIFSFSCVLFINMVPNSEGKKLTFLWLQFSVCRKQQLIKLVLFFHSVFVWCCCVWMHFESADNGVDTSLDLTLRLPLGVEMTIWKKSFLVLEGFEEECSPKKLSILFNSVTGPKGSLKTSVSKGVKKNSIRNTRVFSSGRLHNILAYLSIDGPEEILGQIFTTESLFSLPSPSIDSSSRVSLPQNSPKRKCQCMQQKWKMIHSALALASLNEWADVPTLWRSIFEQQQQQKKLQFNFHN